MGNFPSRPAWKHKRPAPRAAKTFSPETRLRHDDIVWTRQVEPRERYRILYSDSAGARTERTIDLLRTGHTVSQFGETAYLGVMDRGQFKSFRADRIVAVIEQLTEGHPPSLKAALGYPDSLPSFPLAHAIYRIPTTAHSKGPRRTWLVDLNLYTCTCPEKRIRSGFGYAPGQLGFVCAHMAKAILVHLPANASGWSPELLAFLRDPRKVHIDNLK